MFAYLIWQLMQLFHYAIALCAVLLSISILSWNKFTVLGGSAGRVSDYSVAVPFEFDVDGFPSQRMCDVLISSVAYQNISGMFGAQRVLGDRSSLRFLHIPKTGGTSVTQYFPRIEAPPFDEQRRSSARSCPLWHVPPRYFRRSIYERRVVFCFVREPLARAISEFKMTFTSRFLEDSFDATKELNNWLEKLPLQQRDSPTHNDGFCHFVPQYRYVWDEYGQRTCHHVRRLEDGLSEGFNYIVKSLYKRFHITAMGGEKDPLRGHAVTHHQPVNLTTAHVKRHIASGIRRFYWQDYCLLDYAGYNYTGSI